MNYAEKLKDPRWQKKRLEIMDRDLVTLCEDCHEDTHKECRVFENRGFLSPFDFLEKYHDQCYCVQEIGNHKGIWEIRFKKDGAIFDKIVVLYLLRQFIQPMDCNIKILENGSIYYPHNEVFFLFSHER